MLLFFRECIYSSGGGKMSCCFGEGEFFGDIFIGKLRRWEKLRNARGEGEICIFPFREYVMGRFQINHYQQGRTDHEEKNPQEEMYWRI